jgi:sugar lactone lactonase YvrE
MVALARRAVERAALSAGMMPIPLRVGRGARWRFNPRHAVMSQRVQAVVLVALVAGAAVTAASLRRDVQMAIGGLAGTSPSAVATTGREAADLASALETRADVAIAPDGDLLFADTRRGVIHRVDLAALDDPLRAGTAIGIDDRELMTAEWRIDSPASVAVAANGDVYVADTQRSLIRRVARRTGEVVTLAGSGAEGFDGDLKPATAARLFRPTSIAVAPNGDVYIADTSNHRIRVVSPRTGLIRTVAGDGNPGPAGSGGAAIGDGGPAVQAHLSSPTDVAIAPTGDIYIADMGHHRVRIVDADTGIINTVAGDGVAGSRGDGGPARGASLAGPSGLALRWSGRRVTLYVAEMHGGNVRVVSPAGSITTLGPPGRFGAPSRLAYRRGGWLYIADSDGAVDVVNVLGRRPLRVDAVVTRGRRDDALRPEQAVQ